MAVLRAARDAGRGTVKLGGKTSGRGEGEVQVGSECGATPLMDQSRRILSDFGVQMAEFPPF